MENSIRYKAKEKGGGKNLHMITRLTHAYIPELRTEWKLTKVKEEEEERGLGFLTHLRYQYQCLF